MKRLSIIVMTVLLSINIYAQIGYQVSLLSSATGEPRANETVSVTVTITNSEDAQIFSSTQSATTNDFGVLSLQIGNSTTFDNVDWSKLPFFISAIVDGVVVGKSQILNVPVAEAAKRIVDIPLDKLCAKGWKYQYGDNRFQIYNFNKNSTCSITWNSQLGDIRTAYGNFFISGNHIIATINYGDDEYRTYVLIYLYDTIVEVNGANIFI